MTQPTVTTPWSDIFACSKAVVSIDPRNLSNPALMIRYAENSFTTTFGYSPKSVPGGMRASILIGNGTLRHNWFKIENAVLSETTTAQYINLYTSAGTPLTCHVCVVPISRRTNTGTGASTHPVGTAKIAVLTFRSASVIGNSKRSGVGLLGIKHVGRDTLTSLALPGSDT